MSKLERIAMFPILKRELHPHIAGCFVFITKVIMTNDQYHIIILRLTIWDKLNKTPLFHSNIAYIYMYIHIKNVKWALYIVHTYL